MSIGMRGILGLVATAVGTYYGYPQLGSLVGGAISSSGGSTDVQPQGYSGPDPASTQNVTGTSLGSYAPLGAAAISGLAGYEGAQATNAQAAANAQAQMNFQATQTSTAYQRAVQDMQAAGLNPMLAYSQGGAQSGSGAAAPVQNALGAGVSSALQGAQTVAQVKQLSAGTDNLDAQTDLAQAQRAKTIVDTAVGAANAKNISQDTQNKIEQLTGIQLENQLRTQTMDSKTSEAASQARLTAAGAQRAQYGLNQARNESEFANTAAGRNRPALGWLGELISTPSKAVFGGLGIGR